MPDVLIRLRKAHYSLEDLPETIADPHHSGDEYAAPLHLAEATVDDVAFAIVAAEEERRVAYRRLDALQRLYKLAREAGGVGADRVAIAALKQEGR